MSGVRRQIGKTKERERGKRMSVLDKLSRFQAGRPKGNSGGKIRGIFHIWKEGANRLRLAGEFLEVRTHYIAPNPKRKDRGLCMQTAFQGDDKIPQVVNCHNWDIALERPKKQKTCPICKLNAIARAVLSATPSKEEKEFFEELRKATRPTSALKWNIIDRDDPMVIVVDGEKEDKVLGFKIASIGPEAAADIFGIYGQVGYDINDPDKGIDIEVIKDSKGARTTYTARAVVQGTSLKVTPFTAEERKLEMHDLKMWCGKQTDIDRIVDALHEDLREIVATPLEDVDEAEAEANAEVDAAVAEVSEPEPEPAPVVKPAPVAAKPAPATKPAAPVTPAATKPAQAASTTKVPSSVLERLGKKTAPKADADAIPEDGDGMLDAEGVKKK